MSYHIR